MQISVHRSNKNFVRSVRITPFHLTRSAAAHPPPPHLTMKIRYVLLASTMFKMTIVRLNKLDKSSFN